MNYLNLILTGRVIIIIIRVEYIWDWRIRKGLMSKNRQYKQKLRIRGPIGSTN